jgi:predicted ATPase
MTIHLRSVRLKDELPDNRFPFQLPVIRSFPDLEFNSPVTFLVGENGSGKSTVLEALACAVGSITAGSEQASRDASLKDVRDLGDAMRLVWSARTRRGFFLRAEDFIGFVKRQSEMRSDMQAEIREIDEGEEYRERSDYVKGLAKMPYVSSLHGMRSLYGEGLDVRSHGEQFMDFFQARFKEKGLYLLDEPEAPLSPLRQLGFLSVLKEMVAQDSQFIIASHSPILMAFPDAKILSFEDGQISQVDYDSLEHVRITRDFLNDPQAFLHHL